MRLVDIIPHIHPYILQYSSLTRFYSAVLYSKLVRDYSATISLPTPLLIYLYTIIKGSTRRIKSMDRPLSTSMGLTSILTGSRHCRESTWLLASLGSLDNNPY